MAKKRKEQYFYQDVYDRPYKKLVGRYLSSKGKRLLLTKQITEEEAYAKYGKNRYEIDPEAKYIKTIRHKRF